MSNNQLNKLPLKKEIETQKVLKKAISANRTLANLNGVARIIPNSAILINSLVLQEAKDSSEIENIITTHDELYRANLDIESVTNEAKEVQNYKEALLRGYALVKDTKLLLKKHIVEIQGVLENNDAGGAKTSRDKSKKFKHFGRSKYFINLELFDMLKKGI
ncbi:MAG: Fic/DOC family N-terminal domain-containing protein [Arcobacteraceae bacterium]|jgi:Fic family protein|nr:Fic/DOC family N-terminal domain-containing protein [Arcobacteraceae bacterium]